MAKIEGSPKIYPKGWGHEVWICNNDLYCCKHLFFQTGKKCSWHYHVSKHETFYIVAGIIKLDHGYESDIAKRTTEILYPGDRFEIPPGLNHQMEGVTDSIILEVSTHHEEEDSIRLIKGD